MFGTLVAAAYHNFLGIVQVVLRDALYLLAHGGGEEERVSLGWHTSQDGIDALGETHVEHLVGLVQHHVLHGAKFGHLALHEVNQAARRGHDDLYTFLQRTNLRLDARTAIHGQHVQPFDILGIVFQVVGDLQTQFAGGCHDDSLHFVATGVNLLQHGQSVGRRLACTRLCQRHHVVVVTEQIGNHFFLHRHGADIAHFLDGTEDFARHT